MWEMWDIELLHTDTDTHTHSKRSLALGCLDSFSSRCLCKQDQLVVFIKISGTTVQLDISCPWGQVPHCDVAHIFKGN